MKEKKCVTQSAIDELVEETGSIGPRARIREKVAPAGVYAASLQLDCIFNKLRLTDPKNQEKYFREALQFH